MSRKTALVLLGVVFLGGLLRWQYVRAQNSRYSECVHQLIMIKFAKFSWRLEHEKSLDDTPLGKTSDHILGKGYMIVDGKTVSPPALMEERT